MKRFTDWLPIAYAMHDAPGLWAPVDSAPMEYRAARSAYDRGDILMANRRLDDRTLLVIKLPLPQVRHAA